MLQPQGVWLMDRKLIGRASCPQQEVRFRWRWISADSSGHKTTAETEDKEEEEQEGTWQLRGHDTMTLTTAMVYLQSEWRSRRKENTEDWTWIVGVMLVSVRQGAGKHQYR